MSLISIVIVILLGMFLLQSIIKGFSFIELLGFSFPIGIGVVTVLMFFLEVLGLVISKENILVVVIGMILLLSAKMIYNYKEYILCFRRSSFQKFFLLGKFNLLWLTLVSGTILLLVIVSSKSLYWPTFAADSVTSFDLFGKVIASEGTILNSSIYEKSVGFGAAYPPLYSLSLAYVYIFGFESSKIIPVLFFISLVVGFYALLLKNTSSIGAALGTLFMMISPELISQSAINITSVPQAMFGATGLIALLTWNKTKETKYLYLSVLLLAFNGWIRSEGIVYIGAAFLYYCYILFVEHKVRDYIKPVIFLFASVFPFIMWQLFMRWNINLMDSFVQVDFKMVPSFDKLRLAKILSITKFNFFSNNYYGITIYVFFSAIVFNLIRIYSKKDSLVTLIVILIPLFGYLFLINQIELRSDSIDNIMKYSAKRFFFGIVILMWFYIVQSFPFKQIFYTLDTFLSPPSKAKR